MTFEEALKRKKEIIHNQEFDEEGFRIVIAPADSNHFEDYLSNYTHHGLIDEAAKQHTYLNMYQVVAIKIKHSGHETIVLDK